MRALTASRRWTWLKRSGVTQVTPEQVLPILQAGGEGCWMHAEPIGVLDRGMIMNKKLIAAVAPLTLALPLALAGPVSAAPVPRSHPTQLTCDIKASPVKVVRGPALIRWEASVAKKQSRDKVVIQITDNGRSLLGTFVRVPTFAQGVTRDQRGTDVLKITAYDPSTHQQCVDIAVVKEAHR
jgi:hypothetical protein